MTVLKTWICLSHLRGIVNQVLIVILINIPTLSFGLAFGWVSLVSGETGEGAGEGEGEAVLAAVTTFTACMVGVPLSAWAVSIGRRFGIIATSFMFVLCWSLKLASGSLGVWSVIVARVVAGLGGSSAWAIAPLIAREMCSDKCRGAAVTTLPLMHNVGVLLMYLAADAALPQNTILWLCLCVSVIHCVVSLFMPESPSFLAAHGKTEEAQRSLAWLRGKSPDDPSLSSELAELPTPEPHERSPFGLAKAMLGDPRRRKAFIISSIAIVGQEMCGILAIMQYAERVFILASDAGSGVVTGVVTGVVSGETEGVAVVGASESLASPSRQAVLLGVVQLVFAAFALYLVERVGRRPLLVWSATLTGAALAGSAALVHGGSVRGATIALAAAVAADAAGLQPTPYSLLSDMFDYEFRGCALMLATAGASAGNTLESALFPGVVAVGGLPAGLGLAAALTLAYALFAVWAVPETKDRTLEEIYQLLCPKREPDCESGEEPTADKTLSNNQSNRTSSDEEIKSVNKIDINGNGALDGNEKHCVPALQASFKGLSQQTEWVKGEQDVNEAIHQKIINNILSRSHTK